MKNRMGIIVLLCVLTVFFTLGATGAINFVKDEQAEGTEAAGKDRLIGLFITTEYLDLFDFESYIQDNADQVLSDGQIIGSDNDSYQDKIYAKLVDDSYTNSETGETETTKKYVFESMEGIAFFAAKYTDESGMQYWGIDGDDAIADVHTGLHSTDIGDSIELKGTIYVSTENASNVFYYNPVYQTANGEVYVESGQGMSHGGELSSGMSSSHALKEEQTVTKDGESETVSSNIEVSTCFMDPPISSSVIQFGENGNIISREEYVAGELPIEISTHPETEYIVVETHMKSGNGKVTVMRELFQKDDDSLFTFFCREGGICIKHYSSIVWNQ